MPKGTRRSWRGWGGPGNSFQNTGKGLFLLFRPMLRLTATHTRKDDPERLLLDPSPGLGRTARHPLQNTPWTPRDPAGFPEHFWRWRPSTGRAVLPFL